MFRLISALNDELAPVQVEDMVKGVMGLISEAPESGAVLRVTLRRRGTVVSLGLGRIAALCYCSSTVYQIN